MRLYVSLLWILPAAKGLNIEDIGSCETNCETITGTVVRQMAMLSA